MDDLEDIANNQHESIGKKKTALNKLEDTLVAKENDLLEGTKALSQTHKVVKENETTL